MSGLGAVSEGNGLYLSIAGGFIWNRKAEQSDPNYATQEFTRADKTTGVRAGARYADLTGKVIGVQFRTHDEYGESINVTVQAGEVKYILSVSTNNRYSQDLMKALLKMDLEKPLFIKPYDFVGNDKKRATGISFRQDGEKLALRVDEAPSQDKDWFNTAKKKDVKRFFEDLSDWFVAEVEENVCPKLVSDLPKQEESKPGLGASSEEASKPADDTKEDVKEDVKEDQKVESPVKMKRALRAYISENYEGKELPKLPKEDLIKWYNLCLQEEELPFGKADSKKAEVEQDDLDSELDNLLGGDN